MTTTLIVLAHPEPGSFNGAWAAASQRASGELGGEVLISDLCAMGFDAVERAGHYDGPDADGGFDPLKAQERAAETNSLPPDVAAEIGKLRRADRVILHFPIWWFAPPAILKGWCDRVLAHGALHSVEARFDAGLCRDKSALFCVTTGSSQVESAHDGKEGDIRLLLWPLAYTFRYLGFTVLAPECVHGVHGYHSGAERAGLERDLHAVLDRQRALIDGWAQRAHWPFNPDSDFDVAGRLRPGAPVHSPFIRHDP